MDVRGRLNSVFCRVFDNNNITISDEMTADDVEEWDSLAHINLIMEIEAEFDIKFTVNDIIDLKNVGEIIELIARKCAARASS